MWATWKAAAAVRNRGMDGRRRASVHALACLLTVLAAAAAVPAYAAEGKVYRCERDGNVVYTDIGCSLLPPVRLGRPVGTVDPLTEGERALLERMQRGTAGAHGRSPKGDPARARGRARATANAKGTRCTATAGAEATCAEREPPARRARAKGGKSRRIVSAPPPARAASIYARPRGAAAERPPAEGTAGEVRHVSPGRVAVP